MDKPVSVRDFAMSLPAEGSAGVLAMADRIEALEAALRFARRQLAMQPSPLTQAAGDDKRDALALIDSALKGRTDAD